MAVPLFKDIIYKDNNQIIIAFQNGKLRKIDFRLLQDIKHLPAGFQTKFSNIQLTPNSIEWKEIFIDFLGNKINLGFSNIFVYEKGLPVTINDLSQIPLGYLTKNLNLSSDYKLKSLDQLSKILQKVSKSIL